MTARLAEYRPAAVLRVSGADALAFLQGQFTQELRSPSNRLCAYGLWLNQKGKVVADSYVLRDAEKFWIVSHHSSARVIADRLNAYIIADDVLVEDEAARWRGWALLAEERELKNIGLPELPATREIWRPEGAAVVFQTRRWQGIAWDWLQPIDAPAPAWVNTSGLERISVEQLEQLRITAAIPRIPADVGPNDLPNEGGLESDAISYSKGCYLGQEVMARLKSMGQVRRRLMRVRGMGATPNCPAALYAGEKQVGEIRSGARDGDGFVGLALLSLLSLGAQRALSLVPNGAPSISVETLPSVHE